MARIPAGLAIRLGLMEPPPGYTPGTNIGGFHRLTPQQSADLRIGGQQPQNQPGGFLPTSPLDEPSPALQDTDPNLFPGGGFGPGGTSRTIGAIPIRGVGGASVGDGGSGGGGGSRTVRVGGRAGRTPDQLERDWRNRLKFRARLGEEQFDRYQQFLAPYLSQLSGALGGGPTSDFNADDPALKAMEESLIQRGGEAQRSIASEMARRGTFQSGPSIAASALQTGETQARLAGTRGRFAESAANRGQRAWETRLQSLMQLIGNLGSSFPQGFPDE